MTEIKYVSPADRTPLVINGERMTGQNGTEYPFREGAYRFVPSDNYTSNFGFQWNRFGDLQVDTLSGSGISKERFFKATRWDPVSLTDQVILEAGCGAGRFTSVILENTKAELHSFDYSNSVDHNARLNGHNTRLHLYQASIFEMPFEDDSFDLVFCFGVLQFTPDPMAAIDQLIRVLKPGGQLVVDFFPKKGWWTKLHAKYILRPYTSTWSNEKLLNKIEKNIDWLIRTYNFFARLGLNKVVNRFLPICDIDNTIPKNLTKEDRRKWTILDTFNMLSPAYDNPLRMQEVVKRFEVGGLTNVQGEVVAYSDQNRVHVVRGSKP